MITVSGAYETHLAGEVTELATCWKITRKDATVYGFTDHTSDLVISGVTYQAALGYTPTDIATSADLAVDNLELTGILDSPAITEADLMAGVWDYAAIEVFEVIHSLLSAGTRPLRRGRLGEVRVGRSMFIAEMRGLTQSLSRTIGELSSPSCRADLGDTRCKVVLATYTVTGSVTSVTDNRRFIDTSKAQAVGYFDQGKITWTGGANNGLSMEVKAFTAGSNFELSLAMPYTVAIGDTYSIYAGCDKLFSTCKDKFNNVINFRGEPHLPGIDVVLRGPA